MTKRYLGSRGLISGYLFIAMEYSWQLNEQPTLRFLIMIGKSMKTENCPGDISLQLALSSICQTFAPHFWVCLLTLKICHFTLLAQTRPVKILFDILNRTFRFCFQFLWIILGIYRIQLIQNPFLTMAVVFLLLSVTVCLFITSLDCFFPGWIMAKFITFAEREEKNDELLVMNFKPCCSVKW